jgi:hypothetical protein
LSAATTISLQGGLGLMGNPASVTMRDTGVGGWGSGPASRSQPIVISQHAASAIVRRYTLIH